MFLHKQIEFNWISQIRVFTKYSITGNFVQRSSHVAARLEASSIRVYIHMANWLLDTDTETQGTSGECVEDIYKMGIIWGQPTVGMDPFKVWSSWV